MMLPRLIVRHFHSSPSLSRNAIHRNMDIKIFRDFKWPNKVTTFEHYKMPQDLLDDEYNYPVRIDTMGIRWPGYWFKRKFVYVAEMEPQLIVPDLEDFPLKPYVSYRVNESDTPPFTAKQLFDQVYAEKIISDFREKQCEEFQLKPEEIDEARLKALQTGSDLFEDFTYDGVRAPIAFTKYITLNG